MWTRTRCLNSCESLRWTRATTRREEKPIGLLCTFSWKSTWGLTLRNLSPKIMPRWCICLKKSTWVSLILSRVVLIAIQRRLSCLLFYRWLPKKLPRKNKSLKQIICTIWRMLFESGQKWVFSTTIRTNIRFSEKELKTRPSFLLRERLSTENSFFQTKRMCSACLGKTIWGSSCLIWWELCLICTILASTQIWPKICHAVFCPAKNESWPSNTRPTFLQSNRGNLRPSFMT